MRPIAAIVAAAALSACTSTTDQTTTETAETAAATEEVNETVSERETLPETQPVMDVPAPTYNEEVWHISGGWPGEYPSGLSVLGDDVVLMGRVHMHEDTPPTVICPVPQNATYQQWNTPRVDSDGLDFVTISEKVEVLITQNAVVDAPLDSNFENKLSLEMGDTLTFLRYIAEGWSIWEHDFVEYEIEEGALRDISDIDTAFQTAADDKLWVQLTCADEKKSRAWLLFDEVLKAEGMAMTPIIGFGDSRDLTEQDRLDAVMQTNFYLEEQARAEAETSD